MQAWQDALSVAATLPHDADRALLVGRVWVPGPGGGPTLVTVRDGQLFDIGALAPTMSALLDRTDAVQAVQAATGRTLGPLSDWLTETAAHGPDTAHRHLLAPNDLQVVKAAGVTFAASMVERVIEEQARGDAGRAEAVRRQVVAVVGDDLSGIRPGSPEADRLKAVLLAQGLWSQYLEVGIGPDAEVFTKAPVLATVGTGADVGIHADSAWNNPEPEVVLAVNSRGETLGAALGNDVNLRDFEGRSALLLGKAKDNNASCAIGPFIRLFDAHFGIADVRRITVALNVTGPEGFTLEGSSSLSKISRDPLDLVAQTLNRHHAYPDGFMLFLGTMFAPTQDRHGPGQGFTHVVGDHVRIAAPELGALNNRVVHADQAPRWSFGLSALMRNLATRQLL
ncbi:MAG: fumarylacetoacetate hydrolase family protein [Variovorax sp.]|nr:fumarylacetoacetate hydrolase family protein [Variovorax sp.]